MGIVYRAYDRLSGHEVALKRVLLPPDLTAEETERELLSLAHEFRTLAGLRHPHIISVLDYGFDAERQPFYTMGLLEGAQTILEAGQSMPVSEQISLLIQACEALAYLHRRGILHHDLKPANMLVANGRVRLLDFGLAVLAQQQRDDDAFGTLQYLAPEVLSGQSYSEAADLYSIGVIAYELLIGSHPFQADTIRSFLQQVRIQTPDLSAITNQPALVSVLNQLLAKSPTERPALAQQVIDMLRDMIGLSEQATDTAIRESYLQAATFVGREAEFAQLATALEQASQRQGSTWLIGGESGVGKSRLLDELRTHALVQGFTVLRGQAVQGGGLPYQLWREPVRRLALDIVLNGAEAGVLKEIVPDLGELLEREITIAPPLTGQAHQERLHVTISTILQRNNRSILLLLEDLQWSGESLDPLRLLQRAVAGLPISVLASYRSDERLTLPDELPDTIRHLQLDRLAAESIATLTSSILGAGGVEVQVVELLQRETEGNAFFLVEMLRALAESAGNLDRIRSMSLPRAIVAGGVQQVMQQRLARMPVWGQPLLQSAAIIGRQLDLRLLHQIAPALDQEQWLNIGAAAALFEVSDERWQFSHDKLRETLLAGLPTPERQQLHHGVARAIEIVYVGQAAYAQTLYDHWRAANDPVRALPYAAVVAEQIQYSISGHMVIAFIEAALAGIADGSDDDSQARLWCIAGETYQNIGNLDQALVALDISLRCGERLSNPTRHIETLTALSWVYLNRSAYAESLQHGSAAITMAEHANNLGLLAQAHGNCGIVYVRLAQYDQGRTAFTQALHYAQHANVPSRIASATNNLGMIAHMIGDLPLARSYYVAGLALSREIGNRRTAFSALNNLGLLTNDLYEDEAAKQYLDEALVVAREMANREQLATVLVNLGSFYTDRHMIAQAIPHLEEGLLVARSSGDRRNEIYMLNNLAACHIELGAIDLAQQLIDQAHELVIVSDNRQLLSNLSQTMGDIAAARGEYAQSELAYSEGVALARERGEQQVETEILLNRALGRWGIDDLDGAAADLQDALELQHTLSTPFVYAHVLAYQALVAARRGDSAQATQHIEAARAQAGAHPPAVSQALLIAVQAYLHYRVGNYAAASELYHALETPPGIARLQRAAIIVPIQQQLHV